MWARNFILFALLFDRTVVAEGIVGNCLRSDQAYDFVRRIQLFSCFAAKCIQVVIGGGTAGLAFASGLSQKRSSDSIVVLEAGTDGQNEPRIYIPWNKV